MPIISTIWRRRATSSARGRLLVGHHVHRQQVDGLPADGHAREVAQSTCACAPGGVSTRRRARIAGAGYARLQYRCTERRLPP
jgi:hypothetical protein